MEIFGKFCFIILSIIISTILGGWVLSHLWEWFIVDTFAIKELSIYEAIGLSFVVSYLTYRKQKKEKDEKEDFWKTFTNTLIEGIIMQFIALGLGYLVFLCK